MDLKDNSEILSHTAVWSEVPCSSSSERGRWHFTHVRARGAVITSPSRREGGTAQTQLSHELCPAESEGSAMQFETHPAIKAGRRIINVVCEWIGEDDPGGEMLGSKCWRITCLNRFNQKSFMHIEQRTNAPTSWVGRKCPFASTLSLS